jgi:para-nitrobenzyl esterase
MAKSWCKNQSAPTYLWFFERNLPGDEHGAWHSADLWYWFGTLDNGWRPFTKKDKELSSEMVDRLCAFVKNASPNVDGLPEWSEGGNSALIFGDNATRMGNPSKFKLWATMFTNKAPGE